MLYTGAFITPYFQAFFFNLISNLPLHISENRCKIASMIITTKQPKMKQGANISLCAGIPRL
jgi:hypothetical protein